MLEKFIGEHICYEYSEEYKNMRYNEQGKFESSDPISKAVGNRLRMLIDENFTNDQIFAKRFGISLRTLQRYKKHGVTDTHVIMDLARFFNVDWKEFFA